jgi:hypothetical protein
VTLAFDIFQGIGVATAVGVRPFLPTVAVGALAAGDVEIHFQHTDYSFLQSAPFLIAMGVLGLALIVLEYRVGAEELQGRVWVAVLGIASIVLGALLFAGSLCRDGHPVWPGFIGGALCALVGIAATAPLLARVRKRLGEDASTLSWLTEIAAVLFAALSVVAPPVGVIGLLALLWLLWRGRGRDDQKYAGLRILR